MKRRLRFGCLLMCFMLLFCDVQVFATSEGGDSSVPTAGDANFVGPLTPDQKTEAVTDTVNSSGDLYKAISALTSYSFSDQAKKDAVCESVGLIVTTFKNSGFSDAAIAGILANAKSEGCLDPFMMQGNVSKMFDAYVLWKTGIREYGEYPVCNTGGAGLFQWTGAGEKGRRTSASNWFKENDPNYLTVTGKDGGVVYLAGSGKQVSYVLVEDSVHGKVWGGKSSICARVGVSDPGSIDAFKNESDPTKASLIWTVCWERPGETPDKTVSDANARCVLAPSWYEIVKGNYAWGDYVSEAQMQDVATTLTSAGYWSEDDLSAYCKLMEINIDSLLGDALRENLNQDELSGLAAWERNVHHDIEENGLIMWCRRIVMLFGILFIMWVSLIYCAYWFDRVNNFFYIDMLGILTFGHLHMSDTEQECTFHVQDIGKEGRKTVNHKTILFICIVGIAFGACIVTGVFYDLLQFIVYKIFKLLGKY